MSRMGEMISKSRIREGVDVCGELVGWEGLVMIPTARR